MLVCLPEIIVSRRLVLVNVSLYEHTSLCENSFTPKPTHVRVCVCVWVCVFSSSVCQCKFSLPCIDAKRVVPVEAQPIALSCPQFFPSLPLPSSLQPSEELKRREKQMEAVFFFFFVPFTPPLCSPPRPPSFPPPLRPLSRWSTPSCPLLRSGLLLRWWWPCRRRGRRPSPWPRGSDTFLWKERDKEKKEEARIVRERKREGEKRGGGVIRSLRQ